MCDSLLYTPFVLREIIVSAEQAILLPEGFGSVLKLREFGHRFVSSRDTRTMAGSARSCLVRYGGKFARFACAGVERLFEFNRCAIPLTAGAEAVREDLHLLQTFAV